MVTDADPAPPAILNGWRARPLMGQADTYVDLRRVGARPRPDESAGEALKAVAAVERAHHLTLMGHADNAEDATTYAVGYRSQATTQKHYLLARDEAGRALATASVQMPLRDNEQLGYLFLNWVPGRSREGEAYAALWAQAQPIFAQRVAIPAAVLDRQHAPRAAHGGAPRAPWQDCLAPRRRGPSNVGL